MNDSPSAELISAFAGWRNSDEAVTSGLDQLLRETESRAVGLWQVEDSHLVLRGFSAEDSMTEDVRNGFTEATKKVALTQTRLGIVSAYENQGPAVAHIDPEQSPLRDSASWLVRFEAVQSLAVPIFAGETILAVIAMSTGNAFTEYDRVWKTVVGLAEAMGD